MLEVVLQQLQYLIVIIAKRVFNMFPDIFMLRFTVGIRALGAGM